MTRLLPLAAAALLLAVACGPNTAGAEGNNTVPQHGGSLKVGLVAEPRTLDPLYADQASELEVDRQMYESLVDVDRGFNVVARLATSWNFTDPTTLVLDLRHGVHFQNGETFTSRAVVFSIEREIKAVDSPRASDVADIRSVSAAGEYRAVLHLKQPEPTILYTLAGPAGMMLSPVAAASQGAEYEFARNPVVAGTGPFMFQFWRRGYHLILKSNPTYWGPQPYLYQLNFTQSSLDFGQDRLKTQDLDLMQRLDRRRVPAAQADPNLQVSWTGGFLYDGILLDEAPGSPFADPARRRAVAAAVDRAALVKGVFNGIDTVANGPLSPASWAFDPTLRAPSGAAGAPAGGAFQFTLKVDTESEHLAEAEALQQQLAAAGIRMLIQPEDPDTIYPELQKHDFEAALWELGGGPDPDAALYSAFHTGGPDNFGLYSNPQVDADLEKARAAGDQGTRRALYQDAQRRLVADAAFVFINFPPVFKAEGYWVHGVGFNSDGTYDLVRTWLG